MTTVELGERLFWLGVVYGTAISLGATALTVILAMYFARR